MLSIFKKIYTKFFGNETPIPPGETELDYIPLDEKKTTRNQVKVTKILKSKVSSLEQEIC